jgi:hypothetical protein
MTIMRALVDIAAISDDDLNCMRFDNAVNYVKHGYVRSEAFRPTNALKSSLAINSVKVDFNMWLVPVNSGTGNRPNIGF